MVFVARSLALAQTPAELTAQINSLLATISSLQAQLAAMQGGGTTTTTVSGYTFTRNLTVGDTGEDVKQLQMVLNSDPATQVAATGVGSPGNETTYFGGLTKAAVIKFQNKYASEILAPVGLSAGTGYVGPSTRAKLNSMGSTVVTTPTLVKTAIEKPTTRETINENNPLDAKKFIENSLPQSEDLIVMFPSVYSGNPGEAIYLYGSGFSKNENSIYFGNNYSISNLKTTNPNILQFSVPDIPTGKYKIWVTSNGYKSNDDAFFIVKDPLVPNPKISDFSPKSVKYGDDIIIKGSGFSTNSNTVYTSYGVIEGVLSTDGKTIKLNVSPEIEDFDPNTATNNSAELDFWFYVVNNNGVSNEARLLFNI